ncbi:hypothetical protein MK543_09700 [Streptococcus gallolyticus subsp. gallolyticus]|uniref:hypothetical protein n=1 Tax=Streptococcus gallolyticus TaxID=315405 RepID=UPI0022843C8C|nr:hypothetical protein [Streptococcus gallolyticus]MCY7172898.1 hypothetical protein [Streptococcus gallolyticus subsp. gallolyticus]MCY7176927.1 hypothetical protein [Streptococcus gallolyticus subsp. gallolyticus]MCY7181582.1 hypothetical protein [Streptococcus gallolyticus subsp. gallolyticus]MCY7197176.1 hypothetical protein [Streptococcus gallolyticus subsp. gallolyticus]MCY7204829.1 hypothetical protein [Streptococcus gallolyticus subsp. gallolyticus]
MTNLKTLIEQEFNKVKKDSHSTCSNSNKPMEPEDVSDLKREIAALEEMTAALTPYQRMFKDLEEPLYDWLLYGRVNIEELPRDIRMWRHILAYTYAWRYAEAKHDADYGMAILDLLQSDMTELVHLGKLNQEAYGEYLEQWLRYLARGLSAFKDSKDYDQYFLKLQEAHKELFVEYIGDMEDYRECVSLL